MRIGGLIFAGWAALLPPLAARAVPGTEFWFAPPDVSDLHGPPGGEPIYLVLAAGAQSATVTVDMPANGAFTPIVANLAAFTHQRLNLSAFKASLETRPTNTVLNSGLHIVASAPVGAAYEETNSANGEDFTLQGADALGSEFLIPLHKHAPFANHSFAAPHQAFASFDIVAAENGTQLTLYPPVPLDGHPALQQFSVTLNRGQTYSAAFTGSGYEQPATHPAGAVVLADKPVAITLKDDSDQNPSGGCYDLIGDQIVPVERLGQDYVAVKGLLNAGGDESVIVIATRNGTQLFLDGSAVPEATLFAGEYHRVDLDDLAAGPANARFLHATAPIYAAQISGFGCEMGMALLPPLERGGSRAVSVVRSDAQTFVLMLLAPAAAVGAFALDGSGSGASVDPMAFVDVPGTGGAWKAARLSYNTTQVPADSLLRVSNSVDRFFLARLAGGAASAAFFGYRSDFLADVGLSVSVTPQPASLPEPGGSVSYAVDVSNTGIGALSLTALADSHLGSLQSIGCSLPQSIAVGGSYHCQFSGSVAGNAAAMPATTVTAQGVSLGTALVAQGSAAVTLGDVLPAASLQLDAPAGVGPDGGSVVLTATLRNTGTAEALRLVSLTLEGADLDGQGDCALAAAQALAPGASYACSFPVAVSGAPGSSQTLHVAAQLQDDELNAVNLAAEAAVALDTRLFADGFETTAAARTPELR